VGIPVFDSWRKLSVADLEREYSPSSCIGGDYHPFIRAYRDLSVQARDDSVTSGYSWNTISYGALPTQYMELCHRPGDAEPQPLFVFFHGGYWQELSANDSLFAATECTRKGWAFAAVNYTLAPTASIEEITAECIAAVRCLIDGSNEFRIAATRVVLCGSSAGAHLASMVAIDLGAQGVAIEEVVLISGIFWLEPLVMTTINAALGLTEATARRNSPGLMNLVGFPPSQIIFGEVETDQFKQQSMAFAQQVIESGGNAGITEIPGRNHFDVALAGLLAD
jgi:arylformamidase